MQSNYEKQVYLARELFLNYDQERLIRKFQLRSDADFLYLDLLGRPYRVNRHTGEIEEPDRSSAEAQQDESNLLCKNTGEETYRPCLDYDIVMTICDVLCCSKELPVLSGEWCPAHSLQVTMSAPDQERYNARYARLFSGHAGALQRACESLGGERQMVPASADVCYKLWLFPFFPVIFQFWEGDEEFDPRIMLLWDRRTLDFMHFETTFYAMGFLLDTLQRYVFGSRGKKTEGG